LERGWRRVSNLFPLDELAVLKMSIRNCLFLVWSKLRIQNAMLRDSNLIHKSLQYMPKRPFYHITKNCTLQKTKQPKNNNNKSIRNNKKKFEKWKFHFSNFLERKKTNFSSSTNERREKKPQTLNKLAEWQKDGFRFLEKRESTEWGWSFLVEMKVKAHILEVVVFNSYLCMRLCTWMSLWSSSLVVCVNKSSLVFES